MSKGSSGMEVILASLEVSPLINTTFHGGADLYIATLKTHTVFFLTHLESVKLQVELFGGSEQPKRLI